MTGTDLIVHEPRGLAAIERLVRRRFWARLPTLLASLPFAEMAAAAYFCAIDRRTPAGVKLGLLVALAGLVTPARVLPRILQRLGIGIDTLGIVGALHAFHGHITPAHRLRAREAVIRARRRA